MCLRATGKSVPPFQSETFQFFPLEYPNRNLGEVYQRDPTRGQGKVDKGKGRGAKLEWRT